MKSGDWLRDGAEFILEFLLSKVLVFFFLCISAPFWLFLRAWYGWGFLFLLALAVFCAPMALSFTLKAFIWFGFPELGKSIVDSYPFYHGPAQFPKLNEVFYTGIGPFLLAQIGLRVLYSLYLGVRRLPSLPAFYAGSFILRPTDLPLPPVEVFTVLAWFAFRYYGINLSEIGLVIPPSPFLAPGELFALFCYTMLAFDCYGFAGQLRYFGYGDAPKPKKKRIRRKPAKIKARTDKDKGGLEAIFSRRDQALAKMAQPEKS